jgi:multidrug efflux pump subunit AcrA (membrane-fusion protein)
MSYNPGLQAMLDAQRAAADAARRASIAAQQRQYQAEKRARQQAAAARSAARPQIRTPQPRSGMVGQPPRRITAPPSQPYYGSTEGYADEDGWIIGVIAVIVVIVIILVL